MLAQSRLRLEDTPTISLCIPARNETHALEDCLVAAVSSDYEKLEIIVLDDCSQDKTSDIIRSFAQDGVRFVQGLAPGDEWLGKNNAYRTLAQEARGEYLVFVSVDTRLDPTTVTKLVGYMQDKKLSMVSVLPQRRDVWRASVLWAPLRYFWQMVLPLGLNTPTATSLWAIRSDSLAEHGSFEVFKDKILLENELAKMFFTHAEYRFLLAGGDLRVWYAKKWSSQVETAIRLWYPSLRKSLFQSAIAIVAHFLLFIFPIVGLVIGFIQSLVWVELIAFATLVVEAVLFFRYLSVTHKGLSSIVGVILLPLVALQEIALIVISVYQYKRGRVSWKGRNICYPKPARYKRTQL